MNDTFESLRLCRKDVASAAFVVKTIAQHRQRVCAINAIELSTYWEALAEGAGAIPALENIELSESLELSERSEAETTMSRGHADHQAPALHSHSGEPKGHRSKRGGTSESGWPSSGGRCSVSCSFAMARRLAVRC